MKSVMIALIVLIVSLLCLTAGVCYGQKKVDNATVKSLDLSRYLGSWYEIARFDHSFERGLTNAKAHYALNQDGTITVTNSGIKDGKAKEAKGKARLTDTVGRLRVSFFGPFYSDYRVLMLSDDYSYVLVGSKSPKYLWILSRTRDIPGDDLARILDVAESRGYDTDKLIWVDHSE